MADSETVRDLSAEPQTDAVPPVRHKPDMSALEALERLQRAAETLSADAEKLRVAQVEESKPAAPADEASDAKTESKPVGKPAVAAIPIVPGEALRKLAAVAPRNHGPAAAAALCGVAICVAALLGVRAGMQRQAGVEVASVERAQPARPVEDPVTVDLRRQIHALSQEVQGLRTLVRKQGEDIHAAQAQIGAGAARDQSIAQTSTQASVRVDKLERDIATKLERQTAQIERLERLAADPVVTSSIAKSPSETKREGLRTADPGIPAGKYVLRSVRDGVAVIQTSRGMIEVAKGDTIPGVGRVRSVEKVDGRWVVLLRDGVIDAD